MIRYGRVGQGTAGYAIRYDRGSALGMLANHVSVKAQALCLSTL